MARLRVRDFSYALSFDGAATKIALTQTSGLPLMGNSAWSFAGWVKVNTFGAANVIWGEGNTGSGNQLVEFAAVSHVARMGRIRYQVRNDSGTWQLQDKFSATQLAPNRWYHICLVDNNGDVHLYIDGVEDANTVNNSWDYTRSTYTMNTSVLGALTRTTTTNYFNGKMDAIRLYKTALTSAQVQSIIYPDIEPDSTNLVGKYDVNEGSGTTATDTSGKANTGTITSGTYSTDVVMTNRSAI